MAGKNRIVSVIVPARNAGRTLARTLDCLATLPVPAGWSKEIIVGYQDSTDDTLEIIRARDVRLVRGDGSGPSANRNAAVAVSTGELLHFIDADACPASDDFLVRAIDGIPTVDRVGAYGGSILIEPSQRWNPIALGDHFACWFGWHNRRPAGKHILLPTTSVFIPRDVFEKAGGFDESLQVLEDFDLEQRIKDLGFELHFDPELAVTHFARAGVIASLRHSWRWGQPVRDDFYGRLDRKIPFLDRPRLFWLNLPGIFVGRLRRALRHAWTVSRWQACYSLPFLTATVFAWSLSVVAGRRQPSA